jgi:hypothetical protein
MSILEQASTRGMTLAEKRVRLGPLSKEEGGKGVEIV